MTGEIAVKEGMTNGCTLSRTPSDRFSVSVSAHARASAPSLFIFQLVPIHRRFGVVPPVVALDPSGGMTELLPTTSGFRVSPTVRLPCLGQRWRPRSPLTIL
jgi:hypothetical protein